jgi:F-type H+-transporting ATPase subunit h
MYLRELQGYKPTPLKATDSEGHVQQFSIPKAPATPEEANLANQLKDYETQQPEIEGQAASGGAPVVEDWFEEDEEPEEAHH